MLRQEGHRQLPGCGGIVGAGVRVFYVFKAVPGVGENGNVNCLSESFHLRLKLVDVGRSNALVLSAKNAENGGIDLLERGVVRGKVTVVDDGDLELRIGDGEIQRVAATHAPSDITDAGGIDV